MTTKTYKGIIDIRSYNDEKDTVFLSGSVPLSMQVANDIRLYGEFLTVRYYTGKCILTEEEFQESFLYALMGEGDARYNSHYSELTGYLWTDEDLNVGGHDLLKELESFVGQYCMLIIDFSKDENSHVMPDIPKQNVANSNYISGNREFVFMLSQRSHYDDIDNYPCSDLIKKQPYSSIPDAKYAAEHCSDWEDDHVWKKFENEYFETNPVLDKHRRGYSFEIEKTILDKPFE